MGNETSIGGDARSFPATAWSMIVQGDESDPEVRKSTLERLLGSYWKPIYCCVRFGWNKSPEDAKDSVQGFFADLLDRNFVREIDRRKGRFRSYLKAALKNYMLNAKRDAAAVRRGGGKKIFTLDGYEELTGKPGEPDSVFDSAWLRMILAECIELLREKLESGGREKYFQAFQQYDLTDEVISYDAVASRLDIATSDIRNYLHYARKTLRSIVIKRVSEYALDEGDTREELRWILG